MIAKLLQSVRLFVTLWTLACQAPLSMGFSRQEYWSGLPRPPPGTTLPVSWKSCMQVGKWQLELDMEQQTGSKSGKEYVKAVYYHPAYLTSMQRTSWGMLGWMKHKLESRLLGDATFIWLPSSCGSPQRGEGGAGGWLSETPPSVQACPLHIPAGQGRDTGPSPLPSPPVICPFGNSRPNTTSVCSHPPPHRHKTSSCQCLQLQMLWITAPLSTSLTAVFRLFPPSPELIRASDPLVENQQLPEGKEPQLQILNLLWPIWWWFGGLVAKSCLTLVTPMDCSLPGSSVHGILQARILEWVAMSFFW